MAYFPASMALFTPKLLAEGVALVPLDGSTVVEGTVCSTIVSSPDDDIRGILAAGLKKAKHKSANQKQKVLDSKITSYLLVASSLGGAAMLPRHGSSTPGCPVWVSVLGVGLRSLSLLSPASSSSAQPRLYISIVCMRLHMNIFGLG